MWEGTVVHKRRVLEWLCITKQYLKSGATTHTDEEVAQKRTLLEKTFSKDISTIFRLWYFFHESTQYGPLIHTLNFAPVCWSGISSASYIADQALKISLKISGVSHTTYIVLCIGVSDNADDVSVLSGTMPELLDRYIKASAGQHH